MVWSQGLPVSLFCKTSLDLGHFSWGLFVLGVPSTSHCCYWRIFNHAFQLYWFSWSYLKIHTIAIPQELKYLSSLFALVLLQGGASISQPWYNCPSLWAYQNSFFFCCCCSIFLGSPSLFFWWHFFIFALPAFLYLLFIPPYKQAHFLPSIGQPSFSVLHQRATVVVWTDFMFQYPSPFNRKDGLWISTDVTRNKSGFLSMEKCKTRLKKYMLQAD